MKRTLCLALTFLAVTLFVAPASLTAQEQEPEKKTETEKEEKKDGKKKKIEDLFPVQPEGGKEDKLLKIIQRLEQTLTQAEELLLEATLEGVGEMQEQVVKDLDELLKDSGAAQAQAISDIDELIANAPRSSQGGSSSSNKQNREKKPKPSEQKQQEEEAKRDRPKPDQQQQSQQEDNSQQEQNAGDKKLANDKPKDKSGSPQERADIVDRWGTLPPKMKERISKRDFSKFPPEYREKLMKYYKRLNEDDR